MTTSVLARERALVPVFRDPDVRRAVAPAAARRDVFGSGPTAAGGLALRDRLHSRRSQTGSTVIAEPSAQGAIAETHRGHACCLDPRRSDRYTLVREGADGVTLVPARCRLNGCPCCGPQIVRRNQARAFMGLDGFAWHGMLTITLDPEAPAFVAYMRQHGGYLGRGAERYGEAADVIRGGGRARGGRREDPLRVRELSVRYIGRVWNEFVTLARRYEPEHDCRECGRRVGGLPRVGRHRKGCGTRALPFAEMGFFKGLELQRNGRAHLHVLLRFESGAQLMAFQSAASLGGPLHSLAVRLGAGGARPFRKRGVLHTGFEFERSKGTSRDVARYVAKVAGSGYASPRGAAGATALPGEVAKVDQAKRLPPRARRATWSMGRRAWAPGWRRPLRDAGVTWSFSTMAPERLARHVALRGFELVAPRAPVVPVADRREVSA